MAKSDKTVLVSDENHVILDKWYYEELINTAARVDVLITLIDRDKYITIPELLAILDRPKGNRLLREMDQKLSEEKGETAECVK
jgi:hypothetical protein